MKTNYIVVFLFFITLGSYAQDKKFSIEVNYPLTMSGGFQDLNGVVDGSLKYRFSQSEVFNFGASFTFDYLEEGSLKIFPEYNNNVNMDIDYYFYHINGFVEMTLPSVEKLHPFLGVGFTIESTDSTFYWESEGFESTANETESNLGFNFQFGLQYDISPHFYVQSYFHYIRTYEENDITDANGKNYNLIKFGVGYRF